MEQGFVGEDSGRTDLHEIPAEFILQRPVPFPAKVERIMRTEDIEVSPARVVSVESYAAVALDAPVHLVPNERAEILITMSPFRKPVATVDMPCHDRHVLQMTLPSFVTHRAVVGMIHHEQLNDRSAKGLRFGIVDRNTSAMGSRSHAGHHQPSATILFVFELFDS